MFNVLSVETGLAVTDIVFPDAKTAQAFANEHKAKTGERVRLSRIVTEAWRAREAARLQDGTYAPLPAWWQAAPWWQGSEAARDHYAHMAKDGARIAFTESAEKGAADSQLVLSGTKYLARYFSNVLAPHDIAQIGLQIGAESFHVQFSDCADMFEKVYTEGGIPSCMAHDADDYSSEFHPVRVYAAGDLQIAWVESPESDEENFSILARAVVWPAKKTYTRIYYNSSDNNAKMIKALADLGYRKNEHGFTGARLRRKESRRGGFVAPYIDCQNCVTDDGEYLIIDPNGEMNCDNTNGLVDGGSRYSCERCGDGMDEDDSYTVSDESWCSHCYSNHAFTCGRTGESYSDRERHVTVISRHGYEETWHGDSADEDAFYCDNTDAYYHDRYYTAIFVITADGEEQWCSEETESDYFHCENTDKNYALANFTAEDIFINSRETETWCIEENKGEYFRCAICGLFHCEDMRGESDLFAGEDICADCARAAESGEVITREASRKAPVCLTPSYVADWRQIEMAV